MILPLVKYLESHGVSVEYGMDVKNVVIKDDNGKNLLHRSYMRRMENRVQLI